MGTEFYLVCATHKDLFALGRHWEDRRNLFAQPRDKETFLHSFAAHWLAFFGDEDFALDTCRATGLAVWQWCQDRAWQVTLHNDASLQPTEWADWPVTGSVFDVAPLPEPPAFRPVEVTIWLHRRAEPITFVLQWPAAAAVPTTAVAWREALERHEVRDMAGAQVWWAAHNIDVIRAGPPTMADAHAPIKRISATVRCGNCGALEQQAELALSETCRVCAALTDSERVHVLKTQSED